jgi:hypothetical protein
MIDSVISCRVIAEDSLAALWMICITEQTPDLLTNISDKQLDGFCQLLAQLETNETRMEKVLTTAKRIAVREKVPLSFDHIISVIRLSVSPDTIGRFESIVGMEMFKLKN